MKKIIYLNAEIEGYKNYMALELDEENRRLDHYPCDEHGNRKKRKSTQLQNDHPMRLPSGAWRVPYRKEGEKRIMTLGSNLEFESDRTLHEEVMQTMTPQLQEHIVQSMGERSSPSLRQEIRELAGDFLDFSKPCEFEGCQNLREEYLEAIELAGGDNCPECVLRSLNAQFEARALDLLRKRARALQENLEPKS